MVVTAVLFAIVTVLAGVVALGDVVMSDAGVGAKRLAVAHVSLASVGIILLLVAVVAVNRGPAWASFTALLVAGALGLTTLILTRSAAISDRGAVRPKAAEAPARRTSRRSRQEPRSLQD